MNNFIRKILKKAKKAEEINHNETLLVNKLEELQASVDLIIDTLNVLDTKADDNYADLFKMNSILTTELITLDDGEEVLVYIVTHDDEFIMYADGIHAIAKCHPDDEYNPMIGYALCKNRFIRKYLERKYL